MIKTIFDIIMLVSILALNVYLWINVINWISTQIVGRITYWVLVKKMKCSPEDIRKIYRNKDIYVKTNDLEEYILERLNKEFGREKYDFGKQIHFTENEGID